MQTKPYFETDNEMFLNECITKLIITFFECLDSLFNYLLIIPSWYNVEKIWHKKIKEGAATRKKYLGRVTIDIEV